MLSLFDVFAIFVLVLQAALSSALTVIICKKVDRILQENNTSMKVFVDRIGDLQVMTTNLYDLVLKNDRPPEKNRSNSETMDGNSQLLDNNSPKPVENNNDKPSTEKTDNPDTVLKPSLGSLPPTSPPVLPHSPSPERQIGRDKGDGSPDLEGDLEYLKDHKDDALISKKPEFYDGSVNELKSLENEILLALRRLEKTKSHLEVKQDKEQE